MFEHTSTSQLNKMPNECKFGNETFSLCRKLQVMNKFYETLFGLMSLIRFRMVFNKCFILHVLAVVDSVFNPCRRKKIVENSIKMFKNCDQFKRCPPLALTLCSLSLAFNAFFIAVYRNTNSRFMRTLRQMFKRELIHKMATLSYLFCAHSWEYSLSQMNFACWFAATFSVFLIQYKTEWAFTLKYWGLLLFICCCCFFLL